VKNLNNIDAIIFDLGGVIINIDYSLTVKGFNQLSGFATESLFTQHQQTQLFDEFEAGLISADDFRQGLRDLLKVKCEDADIDRCWNAMLLDIPTARIELLAKLGQHQRIFLLSNTNAIHKPAFDQIFAASFPHYPQLDVLFEQAYYSHQMRDRKPNPSIFQRVIDEQNLDPKRTLFIEDTIRHIEGAKQTGLQTYHLLKPETITNLSWLQAE
jgi:FMN phosphatase YigB (HAD superfamily)